MNLFVNENFAGSGTYKRKIKRVLKIRFFFFLFLFNFLLWVICFLMVFSIKPDNKMLKTKERETNASFYRYFHLVRLGETIYQECKGCYYAAVQLSVIRGDNTRPRWSQGRRLSPRMTANGTIYTKTMKLSETPPQLVWKKAPYFM